MPNKVLRPIIPAVRNHNSSDANIAVPGSRLTRVLGRAEERKNPLAYIHNRAEEGQTGLKDRPLEHALRRLASCYPPLENSNIHEQPGQLPRTIPVPERPSEAPPLSPVQSISPIISALRVFDICGYNFIGQSTTAESLLSTLAIDTQAVAQDPNSPYAKSVICLLRAARHLLKSGNNAELASGFERYEKEYFPDAGSSSASLASPIPEAWLDSDRNLQLPSTVEKIELNLQGQGQAYYLRFIKQGGPQGCLLVQDQVTRDWFMISDPFLIPIVHSEIAKQIKPMTSTDQTESRETKVGRPSRSGRPTEIKSLEIGQDAIQTYHVTLKQDDQGKWIVSTKDDLGKEILARWRDMDDPTLNNSTKFRFKRVALNPSVSLYQVPNKGLYFLINHDTGAGFRCDEAAILAAISEFDASDLIASAKRGAADTTAAPKRLLEDNFHKFADLLSESGENVLGLRGALNLAGATQKWNLATEAMHLGMTTTIRLAEDTVVLTTDQGTYIRVKLSEIEDFARSGKHSGTVRLEGATRKGHPNFTSDGNATEWNVRGYQLDSGTQLLLLHASTHAANIRANLLVDQNNRVLSLPDLKQARPLLDALDGFKLPTAQRVIEPDSIGPVIHANDTYGVLQTTNTSGEEPFYRDSLGKYKMINLESGLSAELDLDRIETDNRILYYNISKNHFILFDKKRRVAVSLSHDDMTAVFNAAFLGQETNQDDADDHSESDPSESLLKPIAEFKEKRVYHFNDGAVSALISIQYQDGEWKLLTDKQGKSPSSVKREKYYNPTNVPTSLLEEDDDNTTIGLDFSNSAGSNSAEDKFLVIKIDKLTGDIIKHSYIGLSDQDFRSVLSSQLNEDTTRNDTQEPKAETLQKLPRFILKSTDGSDYEIIINKRGGENWRFAEASYDAPDKVLILFSKNPGTDDQKQAHLVFNKVSGIHDDFEFYYNPYYKLNFLFNPQTGRVIVFSEEEMRTMLLKAANLRFLTA